MYFLLRMGIFHCYVSLPEGKTPFNNGCLFFLIAGFQYWKLRWTFCISRILKVLLHLSFGDEITIQEHSACLIEGPTWGANVSGTA